jgi:hypothetical protein
MGCHLKSGDEPKDVVITQIGRRRIFAREARAAWTGARTSCENSGRARKVDASHIMNFLLYKRKK